MYRGLGRNYLAWGVFAKSAEGRPLRYDGISFEGRAYRGGSMTGTFRPGDRLVIEPVPFSAIVAGDVVAFVPPMDEVAQYPWVHRVVSVTPGGLVTRGDNNPHADAVLVTAENLLGRVTRVERQAGGYPVQGGRRGRWRGRALRARRALREAIAHIGREPYRRLRASGLVTRLWRPRVNRLLVTTDDGPLIKYVCRRRTVAWWWPEKGRFKCLKPYDLVIPQPVKK